MTQIRVNVKPAPEPEPGVDEDDSTVTVPSTGIFGALDTGGNGSNGSNHLAAPVFSVVFMVLAIIVLAAYLARRASHLENPKLSKHAKGVVTGLLLIVTSFLVFSLLKLSDNSLLVHAVDTDNTDANTLSVTAEDIDIDIELEDEPIYATGKSIVTVQSATKAGYTLVAYLSGDTADLVNKTNPSAANKIAGLSSEPNQSLTANTWGVSLTEPASKDSKIFTGIPNDKDRPMTIKEVDEATDANDTTTLYYATYVTPGLEYGAYTGAVINYIAIANSPTLYMQDVAEWGDSLNTGDEVIAIDRRDDKAYTVAKLEDGNIWMTQNLDLDIDSSVTYTNKDTDLGYNAETGKYETASWTPERSTYATGVKRWDGLDFSSSGKDPDPDGIDGSTHPESYDPGDVYWDGGTYPSDTYPDTEEACLAAGGNWDGIGCFWSSFNRAPDTEEVCLAVGGNWVEFCYFNSIATTGDSHYHIGNYYNWTAAVAMNYSGDYQTGSTLVEQSICPTGWTLPRAGDYYEDSFAALWKAYGFIDESAINGQGEALWDAPIYFIPSGHWYGTELWQEVGGYGVLWSVAQYSGEPYAPYLDRFGSFSAAFSSVTEDTRTGSSIRCVARPKTIDMTSVSGPVYVVSSTEMTIGELMPISVRIYDNPTDAMSRWTSVSDDGESPFYLKQVLESGIVTESYVEFIVTPEMAAENEGMVAGTYSLKGDDGGASYEDNVNILKEAFGYSTHPERCETYGGGDGGEAFECDTYWLGGFTSDSGETVAYWNFHNYVYGHNACTVFPDGSSSCIYQFR